MSVFATVHLWAFPWRDYVVSTHQVGSDPGFPEGPNGKVGYEGGRFGLKALGSAFNPWDFAKATGRGMRWLFVGRKTRNEGLGLPGALEGEHGPGPQSWEPGRTEYNPGAYGSAGSMGGTMSPTKLMQKAGRHSSYQRLDDDGDAQELVTHAQPNPSGNPDNLVVASPAPHAISKDDEYGVSGDPNAPPAYAPTAPRPAGHAYGASGDERYGSTGRPQAQGIGYLAPDGSQDQWATQSSRQRPGPGDYVV